jgi:hypothetical protein
MQTLFGTSSAEGSLVERVVDGVNSAFIFPGATTSTTTTATTTQIVRDTKIYESEGEVFVAWTGAADKSPYYFCINYEGASTTIAEYGRHVYKNVALVLAQMPVTETQNRTGRICRSSIQIDRKGQTVQDFTFFPGTTDLVLMHLEDGLYVVEVDDRSWQNTQLLYPGRDIDVQVDGDRIYIKDGEYILEVYTTIEG